MLRNTIILCLFLGMLSICAIAQLEVSVTSFGTDAGTGQKTAIVHVQNVSNKDVAAFHVALTLRYANGDVSTSQGHTKDFGYRATKTGDPKRGVPKLLVAGESIDLPIRLEENVVEVTANFAAVVYADRTAQGDPEAIHSITFSRQMFAELIAKTEPQNAAAAAAFAKDEVKCGNALCSSLRKHP